MAKVSFSKTPSATAAAAAPAPAAPVTEVVTEAAPVQPVAVAPVTAVATVPQNQVPAPAAPRPFDDENIETTDIVIHRLNIAQRVGDLGLAFTPGSLVYNQTLELIPAPLPNAVSLPIRFLVIGFQPKKYVEKVPYGTQGGNVFETEQEVVSAGGSLDYTEAQTKGIPYYERLATALLFVEKPDHLDAEAFPHEIDGKRYTLALYAMKGSSYTAAAKVLMTARKIGHLRSGGYRSGFWTFQTMLKKFQNGNSAFVPLIKPAGQTSPALQTAVKELIGF